MKERGIKGVRLISNLKEQEKCLGVDHQKYLQMINIALIVLKRVKRKKLVCERHSWAYQYWYRREQDAFDSPLLDEQQRDFFARRRYR